MRKQFTEQQLLMIASLFRKLPDYPINKATSRACLHHPITNQVIAVYIFVYDFEVEQWLLQL